MEFKYIESRHRKNCRDRVRLIKNYGNTIELWYITTIRKLSTCKLRIVFSRSQAFDFD
ncbi:MAG: hypothetical protein RMY64_02650 [Nostoc sp. DedQUE08]|uniref:hypothetical protein n=1 Tax=unclassified Nostoc TaxID=2593658 RepID=UPI002AD41004|nr:MULTISPECIES: hypothetical protein [unclassified Nostoc]MDZ8036063.1 hypothetical protein [Nostoc sp. DedSLP04]MDZ8064527.1 hypothetical protein [Nostoc sp. DedQUE08]MDZ8092696.1 hypothetical protein [Nostoc sp. DedQUE05]MDZ8132559.1 hypothetical protein [Nostoc sp. DedQUE07]